MKGIQKLKSGRYQARYFSGYDAKGKRIYPSKTFRKFDEALKWRNARVHEKDTGQSVEATSITLSTFLDQWWAAKKPEMAANSVRCYAENITRNIKPQIGNIKLASLRPMHLEQWQNELSARLGSSSVRFIRAVLNSALVKACQLGLLYRNPLTLIKAPKLNRKERRVLTPDEAATFLSFCAQSRYGLFFKMALMLGLRPEEVIGLKWSRLDLLSKRGTCQVSNVIVRPVGGGWEWAKPKSRTGARTITLPSSLVAELREHHRRQLEQRMKIGKHYEANDLVFAKPRGGPLGHKNVGVEFRRIADLAGLPQDFRLYDLRHSFVTISLLAGVDMKTVSYEAGHATVAFTLDVYGHVLNEMRDAASDKRERLLAGAIKRHAQGEG